MIGLFGPNDKYMGYFGIVGHIPGTSICFTFHIIPRPGCWFFQYQTSIEDFEGLHIMKEHSLDMGPLFSLNWSRKIRE